MGIEGIGLHRDPRQEPGGLGGYGENSSACSASTRAARRLAFRMDDRKQRLVVDADGGAGHRLLRLGGGRRRRARRARRAARSSRHQGRARLARARRRAARQGPDRAQRSRRQPARSLPRRGDRDRSVQARPQHFRLPHRPARHGPRGDALRADRRRDAVLSGGARASSSATTGSGRSRPISSTSIRATTASRSSRPARTWSIT